MLADAQRTSRVMHPIMEKICLKIQFYATILVVSICQIITLHEKVFPNKCLNMFVNKAFCLVGEVECMYKFCHLNKH